MSFKYAFILKTVAQVWSVAQKMEVGDRSRLLSSPKTPLWSNPYRSHLYNLSGVALVLGPHIP